MPGSTDAMAISISLPQLSFEKPLPGISRARVNWLWSLSMESVLGPALKWEPARDGSLFPHLYGDLTLAAVRWAKPLPLGADGRHLFPDLSTEADGRV